MPEELAICDPTHAEDALELAIELPTGSTVVIDADEAVSCSLVGKSLTLLADTHGAQGAALRVRLTLA